MKKTLLMFVLVLGLSLHLSLALSRADMSGLAERVIEHQLSNGMKVLMVERHQTPVVSINLTFGVGGMNEHTGRTGVAHLYEHMAFKGTRMVGTKDYEKERPLLEELHRLGTEIERRQREAAVKTSGRPSSAGAPALDQLMQRFKELQDKAGEYVVANEMALLYQRHGAVGLNATTGKDLTRYMVSLPSNRLPLWAVLEADRMAHPVLREFYKERSVVMEERRLRTDDNPQGLLFETFTAAAFQAHPYGLPTVGWASDIEALTPAATEEFFKTYYGPAGATVAIVGDIHPKEVIELLERTFGVIPPAPPPPPVVTVEPPQRGERRVEVEFDAEPTLLIGYHKPGIGHPDDFVFDVIDAVLSDGVTSRLYSRLVREKRLAASVMTDTNYPGVRAPNLFVISATPLAPHTAAEVEAAIYEELERLKTEPVTPQELEKVLNNLDASLVRSLRSNSGLASQLAFYQTVAGDWRYILDARDRIAKVTPEDIQRVVAQYLKKSNRTVATLVKMPATRKIAAKAADEVRP
ncbi:MAG TPA: pitrilysin family protein [Nitrospiraceae bacterium]|jgi:predicted Zn-dependent peptidase|nr:pitrilysin family protein [Nitrospiraceae bacterium]